MFIRCNLLGKYDWYVSIFGITTIQNITLELYTGDIIKFTRGNHCIMCERVGKSNDKLTQHKQVLYLLNSFLPEGYKKVLIVDMFGEKYEYKYRRGELRNKNRKINKANFYTKLDQIYRLGVMYRSGVTAFATNENGFWYNRQYGRPVDIDTMLMDKVITVYCTEKNGKKHTFNYT